MGLNFKLSIKGKLFMKSVQPLITILGWGTFIQSIFWAIYLNYSLIQGFLFVAGIQFAVVLFFYTIVYFVLRRKELQWRQQ